MDKQKSDFSKSTINLDKQIEFLRKSYDDLEKQTTKQIAEMTIQFQRKEVSYELKLEKLKKEVHKNFFYNKNLFLILVSK